MKKRTKNQKKAPQQHSLRKASHLPTLVSRERLIVAAVERGRTDRALAFLRDCDCKALTQPALEAALEAALAECEIRLAVRAAEALGRQIAPSKIWSMAQAVAIGQADDHDFLDILKLLPRGERRDRLIFAALQPNLETAEDLDQMSNLPLIISMFANQKTKVKVLRSVVATLLRDRRVRGLGTLFEITGVQPTEFELAEAVDLGCCFRWELLQHLPNTQARTKAANFAAESALLRGDLASVSLMADLGGGVSEAKATEALQKAVDDGRLERAQKIARDFLNRDLDEGEMEEVFAKWIEERRCSWHCLLRGPFVNGERPQPLAMAMAIAKAALHCKTSELEHLNQLLAEPETPIAFRRTIACSCLAVAVNEGECDHAEWLARDVLKRELTRDEIDAIVMRQILNGVYSEALRIAEEHGRELSAEAEAAILKAS